MAWNNPLRSAITAFAKAAAIPFYRRKLQRFEALLPRAQAIQRAALFDKLRRCADSRFGRDHGFASLNTVDDYRRRLPISQYEYFAPYINDVFAGQIDALFPPWERVLMFGASTGTTGEPKRNPITTHWLREYRQSLELWGVKAIVDHINMVGTKLLQITGPGDMGRSPQGLPLGMVSSLSFRYQNRVFQSFYALPYDICDIPDPDAKYYTILRIAMAMPVGFICTITPANLLRVARFGDAQRESLIRDIHDGTLSSRFDVPAALRQRHAGIFRRRHPRRARELEQIVDRTGSLLPKDYWPLSLISCWLGGTVGFQARELATFYGDVNRRDLGLVSTEGHHTIPLENGRAEGVLSIRGNYYEFIPVAERESASPVTLECHELEPGAEYFLVLTTSSGLYRYDLGDVVRCNAYRGQAPILEFLHKGRHCSDMEGEKISEHQVVQAVTTAAYELDLRLEYFTAVPVRPQSDAPYYALLVEDPVIAGAAEGRFLEIVDRELVRQNVMYAGKRNDRYVGAPRLLRLAAGAWTEFAREQATRRGTGDSQYKHPALVADPAFLDRFRPVAAVSTGR